MEEAGRNSWAAASAAFGALGRVFLCLDPEFRVLHASSMLDEYLGPGASGGAEGQPAEDLLGEDLFGEASPLRQALASGERREEWRGELRGRAGTPPRPVEVTAAPIRPAEGASDPRVSFVVVLRSAGEDGKDAARRLHAVLEEHHWHRSRAARALGISRTTLWRMMRDAGIHA